MIDFFTIKSHMYCFFPILGLLYSKFLEILVVLRNFFDETKKEDDVKSREVNVSTASLFAKLGMLKKLS